MSAREFRGGSVRFALDASNDDGTEPRLRSFARDAVPIAVPHVPVRGVRPANGRDPVPARLLARDPAIPVVVVPGEDGVSATMIPFRSTR